MAANPQSFWIAREFGVHREFIPAPASGTDDGYTMDRRWNVVRRVTGGNGDYFSSPDQPINRETGEEGHPLGSDSGGTDGIPVGHEGGTFSGTIEDLRAGFRDYDAQERDSLAPETTGKVDKIDRLLGWMQHTFWFVRKDAYPDFDQIMQEAREFAANPDATMVPLTGHTLRRNWIDKVVTGEDET